VLDDPILILSSQQFLKPSTKEKKRSREIKIHVFILDLEGKQLTYDRVVKSLRNMAYSVDKRNKNKAGPGTSSGVSDSLSELDDFNFGSTN